MSANDPNPGKGMSNLDGGAGAPDATAGSPESMAKVDLDAFAVNGEVMPDADLTVLTGPSAGAVFQLRGTETVIGRGASAQIRVEDKAISQAHAKIVRTSSGHTLMDLGSTNGTLLNGRRLSPNEPSPLASGDSIQIAETVFAYLPNSSNPDETRQLWTISNVPPRTQALARRVDPRALVHMLQQGAAPAPVVTDQPPTIEEQIEKLMKVWAIIKRNWIPVVAAAALCGLAANLTVFVFPPQSEATVRFRVTPKGSENPLQNAKQDPVEQERFYADVEQSFTSPVLMKSTLALLGNKSPDKQAVDGVLKQLKFESVAMGTYQATYKTQSPEEGVRVLKRHLENFLDTEVAETIKVIQTEVDFLRAQMKEREAELHNTEEKLKAFKKEHINGLPEVSEGQFASREQLYLRRADVSAALQKANLELSLARKRLAEEAPLASKRVANAAPYEQSLIDVRRKLGEAKAQGLGNEHPTVVSLQNQAKELERMAEEARRTEATRLDREADPGLQALKARVADMEVQARGYGAELGELNAQLKRLDSAVQQLPEAEATHAQLTRSYAANKELYSKLFGQLRASELELELQRTSAKARYEILSPVATLGLAIRRVLFFRTLIGIAVGAIIGVCIGAYRELRRVLERFSHGSRAIVLDNHARSRH